MVCSPYSLNLINQICFCCNLNGQTLWRKSSISQMLKKFTIFWPLMCTDGAKQSLEFSPTNSTASITELSRLTERLASKACKSSSIVIYVSNNNLQICNSETKSRYKTSCVDNNKHFYRIVFIIFCICNNIKWMSLFIFINSI